MHQVSGGCHCGGILVEFELSQPPVTYSPRACDCDFCRKHGAAYVSDPAGSLHIRIEADGTGRTYRQGSGMAELLLCGNCGVLIGALYRNDGRVYATINAKIVEGPTAFGAEQPVSPKKLAATEKVTRWQDLWFANVVLSQENPQEPGASQRRPPTSSR
jgi:hypothetical protein